MNILNKHDPTIVIDNNNNKKDVDAEEDTTFNGKTQQHHIRSSTHRGVNYMNHWQYYRFWYRFWTCVYKNKRYCYLIFTGRRWLC